MAESRLLDLSIRLTEPQGNQRSRLPTRVVARRLRAGPSAAFRWPAPLPPCRLSPSPTPTSSRVQLPSRPSRPQCSRRLSRRGAPAPPPWRRLSLPASPAGCAGTARGPRGRPPASWRPPPPRGRPRVACSSLRPGKNTRAQRAHKRQGLSIAPAPVSQSLFPPPAARRSAPLHTPARTFHQGLDLAHLERLRRRRRHRRPRRHRHRGPLPRRLLLREHLRPRPRPRRDARRRVPRGEEPLGNRRRPGPGRLGAPVGEGVGPRGGRLRGAGTRELSWEGSLRDAPLICTAKERGRRRRRAGGAAADWARTVSGVEATPPFAAAAKAADFGQGTGEGSGRPCAPAGVLA